MKFMNESGYYMQAMLLKLVCILRWKKSHFAYLNLTKYRDNKEPHCRFWVTSGIETELFGVFLTTYKKPFQARIYQ